MSDARLRTQLIRLAHEHPEFRQDLLPLLREATEAKTAGCEKLPEGPMRENCEKKKKEGSTRLAEAIQVTSRASMEVIVKLFLEMAAQDGLGDLYSGVTGGGLRYVIMAEGDGIDDTRSYQIEVRLQPDMILISDETGRVVAKKAVNVFKLSLAQLSLIFGQMVAEASE